MSTKRYAREDGGFTATFCGTAENHNGMQKVGNGDEKGIPASYLKALYKEHKKDPDFPCKVELVDLHAPEGEPAYVLVYRGLCSPPEEAAIFQEMMSLEWDNKYYDRRRSKVLNKRARHNLVFAEEAQEADLENAKGTIVPWEAVPRLHELLAAANAIAFGDPHPTGGTSLVAEGNYYYEGKSYIGWHGDAERKVVIGARFGYSKPLYFRWYLKSEPVSDEMRITLAAGDMYVMSERATGNDWKKRNIYTLRHCVKAED